MGNQCCSEGNHLDSQQAPNIIQLKKSKNFYNIPNHRLSNNYVENHEIEDQIKQILAYDDEAISQYGGFLTKLKASAKIFQDKKFILPAQSFKCYPVDRLYSKKPIKQNAIKSKDLQQQYKQYTYLTSVFCFLSQNNQLISKILLTQLNKYGFYVVRLFSNVPGKSDTPLLVVVDDQIPTQNNDPKFSHILTYNPWVYLIEKAWAKTLGSYQNARGLSPQDALQQITGIPSYSYSLEQVFNLLKDQKIFSKKFVYLFTAKGTKRAGGLYRHQVFYLIKAETMPLQKIQFLLQCPYKKFSFQGEIEKQPQIYADENIYTGTVRMTEKEVYENFEFLTIGYYKQQYKPEVYKLNSSTENTYYIKFRIQKQQEISIRVSQFYEQYIHNKQYMYSPVYFKLFNSQTGALLSQGCKRSQGCIKSANVFEDILHKMKKGQYLLVIQIEWIRPDLINSANLIFYSSQEIVKSIENIMRLQGQNSYKKYISSLFSQFQKKQNLQYSVERRSKSIYMMFRNPHAGYTKIVVSFPAIDNLKPAGVSFQKNSITFTLQKDQSRIFEFRKIDPNADASLQKYKIELY